MAFQTFPGGFLLPPYYQSGTTGVPQFGGVSGSLINAVGQRYAMCFRVPKTGTLDKAEIAIGTVTNNPDNGLRVSFQDLDASGNPDGTQDQFRDMAGPFTSNTWAVPGLLTSDGTDGGVKRAVTRGDRLGVVVEFVSFVAGDQINFGVLQTGNNIFASAECFADQFSGAAWTKVLAQALGLALKYDDGTYAPIDPYLIYPCVATTTISFNTGSTPDEIGMRFQLPFTAVCNGAWLRFDYPNACDVVLYDSDGTTVLRSVSLVAGHRGTANGQNQFVHWTTDVTLLANTTYRLVLKPTTGSSVSIYTFTVNAAALMQGAPGGAQFYRTHRTDAGAWTDTDTQRVWGGLQLSQIDDGAGGGTFSFNTVCPMIVPPRSVAGY